MAWYRTGTVGVTNGSTAVTGAGTAWVGVVRAGDALIAPDGRNYEVASVNSNTSLTLASDYQGSTASAQDYAIQPTLALAKEWVTAAQAFQSSVQGWEDGPLDGLFGDGTAGAPGIGFASQTNMGFARLASDVMGVSVGGQTRARFTADGFVGSAPITRRVTRGGTANAITLTTGAGLSGTIPTGLQLRFRATAANTGATTIAVDGGSAIACRTVTGVALPAGYIRTGVETVATYDGTNWVLNRALEIGSNVNGFFERHETGVQRCWALNLAITGLAGSGHSQDFPLPAIFAESVPANFTLEGGSASWGNSDDRWADVTGLSATGQARLRMQRFGGTDWGGTTGVCHYTATGRWYLT